MVTSPRALFSILVTTSIGLATSAMAEGTMPPLPLPDDAREINFDGASGTLDFFTAKPVKDVTAFYRGVASDKHWTEAPAAISNDMIAVVVFKNGEEDVANLTVMRVDGATQVNILGPALASAAGNGASDSTGQTISNSAVAEVSVASPGAAQGPLVASEKHGLPLPAGLGNSYTRANAVEKLSFSCANPVAEVVAFYRAELAKRGWQETAANLSGTAAELAFTTPKGPATLSVKRHGDSSQAELALIHKATP